MVERPPFNRGVSAWPCSAPGCTCGSVQICVHGEEGRILHVVVLPRASAEAFLARLRDVVEDNGTQPEPQSDLHAIRCEGTA